MEKITVADIVAATSGTLISGPKENEITDVIIDSRKEGKGSVFFAIKGENTDGHRYIAQAVQNGACAVVVHDKIDIAFGGDVSVILVEDTTEAMLDLAAFYKQRFDIPFIAITGSSGKTTTKDIIAAVLSQKYHTLKTQGNFNNKTGMPLTLLGLNSTHEIAVIELGMSEFGEIDAMARRLCPDVAGVTNIGYSHIGYLQTQENIFKAKSEIFQYLREGQTAIVNGDDRFLAQVSADGFNLVKVGIENGEIRAEKIVEDNDGVSFTVAEEAYHFRLSGKHNVRNCLFAIVIGKMYSLSKEQIQAGFDSFEASANRMDITVRGGITMINDVYNANPDAMLGALDVLKNAAGGHRKIAVLGDMLEMGPYAKALHTQVGEAVGQRGIDALFTVGADAVYIADGAKASGVEKVYHFINNEDLAKGVNAFVEEGDYVLLKGSRGMHLEDVLEKMKKNLEQDQ